MAYIWQHPAPIAAGRKGPFSVNRDIRDRYLPSQMRRCILVAVHVRVVLPIAQHTGRKKIAFKFDMGQSVEYKPVGGKIGLFQVTRQMPEEFQAFDRKCRIKGSGEGFERCVLECDLRPANDAASYASVPQTALAILNTKMSKRR